MLENVCRFIPHHSDYHSIHTINFVFETENRVPLSLKSCGLYRIHYVCEGNGELHFPGRVVHLCKGDIFFTFPDTVFFIKEVENFSYMYISFLGSRASMIMDKLGISSSDFIIKDCHEVADFWKNGIGMADDVSEWMTESILLYTFSYLGKKRLVANRSLNEKSNASFEIKKFIDDNFTNEKFSLAFIGEYLSYSPKYISTVFKKAFKIGICDYIATVRIQHACALINQGFMGISDIASQCGYGDSQYFSKVFKRKMGISPKMYIQQKNNHY